MFPNQSFNQNFNKILQTFDLIQKGNHIIKVILTNAHPKKFIIQRNRERNVRVVLTNQGIFLTQINKIGIDLCYGSATDMIRTHSTYTTNIRINDCIRKWVRFGWTQTKIIDSIV